MTTKLTPKETRLAKGVTAKAAQRVYVTFPKEAMKISEDVLSGPNDKLKTYANSVSFTGSESVEKAKKELSKAESNLKYLGNSVAHQNALGYSGNHTKSFIPKAVEDVKKAQENLEKAKKNS